MVGAQYKVGAQPINLHKVTRSGAQIKENNNALEEIDCQAPFDCKCKFEESRVSHKKWVSSSQEYILEGPTNLKNHPLIVTTKLKKVYK